jgi:probable HAF family extracellular repeat protein
VGGNETVCLIVEVVMQTCFVMVSRIRWGSLTVPVILMTAVLAHTSTAAAQATAYPPTYLDAIDLGTLGGHDTRAYAEHGGRIVGASQTADGTAHAFRYESGAMTDLGTLGGSTSWGFAINVNGAVAGSASLPDDVAVHAFVWTEDGGMVDLGTLGGTYSRASGVNDSGQVSGWSQIPGDSSYHAFVWDPTTGMRDLGTFGGDTSFAYDIGNMVCGEAQTGDGARHAFVSSGDALNDLGTLGGSYSAAINCSDATFGRRIVGESSVPGDSVTHAVWWDSRFTINDIGTLGGTESRGLRVYSFDEIFGESQTVDGDTHPFQWWHGQLSDYARALGVDSRVESVIPAPGPGAGRYMVMSGSAFDGGDVRAYVGFIPWWSTSDPGAARTITEGVFDASSSSGVHFAFHAEDTTADLRMGTRVGQCHPCLAGDTVALGVSRLVTNEAAGTATVRGNSYGQVAMPQVQFTISADSFVIPDTGEQTMTVSSPFTFSGFVLGARSNDVQEPSKLFGFTLKGAGTVTLRLFSCDTCIHDGKRFYDQQALTYSFEQQ